MKTTDIYKMELHDNMEVAQGISVVRVHGGWIYMIKVSVDHKGNSTFETEFVPFDGNLNFLDE